MHSSYTDFDMSRTRLAIDSLHSSFIYESSTKFRWLRELSVSVVVRYHLNLIVVTFFPNTNIPSSSYECPGFKKAFSDC